jgi:NAD(P)-dependent dehydrogenase (short-subunit alcohol dehydrogenase family)
MRAGTGSAIVSGAASGIGRACAAALRSDGLAVASLDLSPAEDVDLALTVDVADAEAVEAAAAAVEDQLGPIDVWVNNAMTTVFAFFDDITVEEFRRATEVTYLGTVWGTRAALGRMLPRDRGAIVQVGSAMAYRGIPLQAPYCGAKHAIKGFVESIRCELRNRGSSVRVSMVQLPGLNTPQFVHCRSKMPGHPQPVPPIYQPEVAAEAVHYAAHHRRREVYVGASSVYTILGNKLAPWLAERYLARTAVDSQQMDAPPTPENGPGNLFSPPAGDQGAHGPFDERAHPRSVQLRLTRWRGALAAAGGAALAAAGAAAARR